MGQELLAGMVQIHRSCGDLRMLCYSEGWHSVLPYVVRMGDDDLYAEEVSRKLIMLRASEFEVAVVQASIFTPDVVTFPQARILSNLLQAFSLLYDGPVTSLPIPPEIPPHVPRFILQSADSTWRLQVSPARMDATWSPSARPAAVPDIAGIIEQCARVLQRYIQDEKVRVGRLALVLQRACVVDKPAQALIEHFCNAGARQSALRGSTNFEMHNHKRYWFHQQTFQINSWVRCRTALFNGAAAVAVEQDLNTLEDDLGSGEFNSEAVGGFLAEASREADVILRLYFAEED